MLELFEIKTRLMKASSKLKELGWKPLYSPKSGFTDCVEIMRELHENQRRNKEKGSKSEC